MLSDARKVLPFLPFGLFRERLAKNDNRSTLRDLSFSGAHKFFSGKRNASKVNRKPRVLLFFQPSNRVICAVPEADQQGEGQPGWGLFGVCTELKVAKIPSSSPLGLILEHRFRKLLNGGPKTAAPEQSTKLAFGPTSHGPRGNCQIEFDTFLPLLGSVAM